MRGASGLVTVVSEDPAESSFLVGDFEEFSSALIRELSLPPRRSGVALVFRSVRDGGVPGRTIDGQVPAVRYDVVRPIPRRQVLRDLVLLEAMVRQSSEPSRGWAARLPDWLTLGLEEMIDGRRRWPASDRLLGSIVRNTGRVPPLGLLLETPAEGDRFAIVRAFGSVLVRRIAEEQGGRAVLRWLILNPKRPDESSMEWLSGVFPLRSRSADALEQWWALACVRTAYAVGPGGSGGEDLSLRLQEALHPVVRRDVDGEEIAGRLSLRDLAEERDRPWFRRAVMQVIAELDRLELTAPPDLRPAVRLYRRGARDLLRGRMRPFRHRMEEAEKAWREAVERRIEVSTYLDRFDPDLAGPPIDLDRLLATLEALQRETEASSSGAIGRYLDEVEASVFGRRDDSTPSGAESGAGGSHP